MVNELIYDISFIQNNMTSVEKMKMSKLMEHSQNHRTDELYEPLRRALSKSTMPHHLTSLRQSVTPEKVNHSNITHNIRLLSAIEADKIRKTTFISAEKELVPTHHIQKVMGKHFYAVDVEERQGQPISHQQFQQAPKYRIEEIVYEYKEEEPGQSLSQMKGEMYMSIHQDKETLSHNFTQEKTNFTMPQYNQTSSQLYRPHSQKQYSALPEEPFSTYMSYKMNAHPSEPSKLTNCPSNFTHYPPNKTQILKPTLKFDPELVSSKGKRKDRDRVMKSQSSSQMSLLRNSGVKSYKFDKKLIDSKHGSRSELQPRKKDDYKYNLFSMLDEPGNHGCRTGCWVNNELVASRRSGTQWN